jgi:uncharacterized protein (TIGR02596 family)
MTSLFHSVFHHGARRRTAFTMVELLVVISIMVVLMTVAIPAFTSISKGTSMETAGQQVADAFYTAREMAVTRNRLVEVRLIQAKAQRDGSMVYRGLQTYFADDTGTNFTPLSRVSWLPENVLISDNSTLSPFLTQNGVGSTNMKVSGVALNCKVIQFHADGTLNVASTTPGKTVVTVVPFEEKGASSFPANYRSVYVNPLTGKTRVISP